jgi:DNA-binding GntR family transcriptional regulator
MSAMPPEETLLELMIDRRQPRAAQLYDGLRAAILDLRLKPGTPISENRICQLTNVSRTPAREAIIRLAQEGLIDVFPQHGSFVAPIRLKKVIEGHFVREALEIALLKRAAEHWQARDAAAIEAIIAAQRALATIGDHRAFYGEDERFHCSFAKIAGMEGVSSVIKDANTHLARVRQLANPLSGHMEAAIADHEAILDGLKAGDVEGAVKAMRRHLDQVFDTVKRLVQHHRDFFEDAVQPEMVRVAAS